MDIFDLIKKQIEGFPDDVEMLSIHIPRDNVKELTVVIAIESAAVESVLKDYRTKLPAESIAGLENAVLFGKSMVHVLSIIGKFTDKELEDTLQQVQKSTIRADKQEVEVHFNKSGNNFDGLVENLFGDRDT